MLLVEQVLLWLVNGLQSLGTQVWLILNPNQPLSWRTFLSLCVFAWLMGLITSDAQWLGLVDGTEGTAAVPDPGFLWFSMSFARWILFTVGWICLCISMAWMLNGTAIVVPYFNVRIFPAAWLVGFLTSLYVFLLVDVQPIQMGAIVAWPSLSALYTLLPKLITPAVLFSNSKVKAPSPGVRQQFAIRLLACTTLSCWLQFSLMIQGWVLDYPVLSLTPLNSSAMVTPLRAPSLVFRTAKATLDQTLQLLSVPEARRWIRQSQQFSDPVNDRFQTKLLQAQQTAFDPGFDFPPGLDLPPLTGDNASEAAVQESVMREEWKMSLRPDGEDRLALRMQLRSLQPPRSPRVSRNAYVEYRCLVMPFDPSNIAGRSPTPEAETRSPGVSRPLEPDSDPNADIPSPDNADNIEQFRQSTIKCEFLGFALR